MNISTRRAGHSKEKIKVLLWLAEDICDTNYSRFEQVSHSRLVVSEASVNFEARILYLNLVLVN